MIERSASVFLDDVRDEIRRSTGAKISRSEIVRAALAGLREIHAAGESAWFGTVGECKSASELSALTVLAAQAALNFRAPDEDEGSGVEIEIGQ